MTTSKNLEISELARKLNVDDSNVSLTGVTIPSSSLQNTGVTAGSYGSASQVPVLTVNAKGQITAASYAAIAGVSTFTYDTGTKTVSILGSDTNTYSVTLSNLATETFVNNAISTLIDASPSTLDTLNELAAALGDDANFASTMTTALSGKVDKINITGGSVGSTSQIPVITYNAQGQITAVSTAALDLSGKVDKINITGATIGSSTAIPVITYNAQGQITSTSTTTISLSTANWTISQSGSNLYFAYQGTNKAVLDSSGNFTVVGNITAYGSV
jgi:hypothetical protein